MTHLLHEGAWNILGLIIPGMEGHFELLLILFIVLLLFGGKRIPELARGLGRGIREFRHAKDEFDEETHQPDEKIRDNVVFHELSPVRAPQ